MSQPLQRPPETVLSSGRWIGLALVLALAGAGAVAAIPAVTAQTSGLSHEASSLPPSRRPAPAKPSSPPAVKAEAKPAWQELTPVQQQTLAPLGASWRSLSEAHKRKWLALAESYPRMSPEEQAKLRSRMTEWATLSPQQRTQARLNFAETKKVAPVDKKAAWEAYQALPAEEKRRLAAGAAQVKPPPPPTAAAVKPVPPQKLARMPKSHRSDAKAPRIAAAPVAVPPEANNLLPAPGAVDIKR